PPARPPPRRRPRRARRAGLAPAERPAWLLARRPAERACRSRWCGPISWHGAVGRSQCSRDVVDCRGAVGAGHAGRLLAYEAESGPGEGMVPRRDQRKRLPVTPGLVALVLLVAAAWGTAPAPWVTATQQSE